MFIPRTLNRWLDINPQNGSLTRTQTFITLPAFTIPSKDQQVFSYSFLQAAWNFESPNAFSLDAKSVAAALNLLETTMGPGELSGALCIMYLDANGNVVRYLLWSADNEEVFYFNIPPYAGQFILQNFRLELWNNSIGVTHSTLPVNFYTSVLGNIDYRYGVDSSLVNADPIITNMSVQLDGDAFDLPMFFPQGSTPNPN